MTATFFGHRDAPSIIALYLRAAIIDLIENKGVDPYIIEDVLAVRVSTDSDSLADRIYAKYGKVDMHAIKVKQRVGRYLAARGFEFSEINDAVKAYIRQYQEE